MIRLLPITNHLPTILSLSSEFSHIQAFFTNIVYFSRYQESKFKKSKNVTVSSVLLLQHMQTVKWKDWITIKNRNEMILFSIKKIFSLKKKSVPILIVIGTCDCDFYTNIAILKGFSCMEKDFFLDDDGGGEEKSIGFLLKVITVAWFSEWENKNQQYTFSWKGPSSDQKPFSHFFLEKSFCAHVSIFLPCWLVWSIPTSSPQHKKLLVFFRFF